MPFPGILGGFEIRQKQFFAYFWSQEKNQKKKFPGKIVFFGEKSVFIGKISDFSPIFFFFRFFHCKIFSRPTEIRFFSEKSVNFDDFFVLGYYVAICWTCSMVRAINIKDEFNQMCTIYVLFPILF